MQPIIDLRSDLLAQPTPEMRARMLEALQDRPSFDLREDPRQRRAEEAIANLLGAEDALLFPTCTMANQAALAVLTRPGDVVIAQPGAHILTSEAGGAAALAGVQIQAVDGDAARPDSQAWELAIREGRGPQAPHVAAISLENTHNRAGGRVLPMATARELTSLADRYGVKKHLDGARLINAAVALNAPLLELAAGFDTASISLNKGFGAPFGAALAASKANIEIALWIRQRLGGGIRRMGVLAAAIEPALADFSHIRDDHRRARLLAEGLSEMPGLALSAPVESNIVIVALEDSSSTGALVAALAQRGVLVLPFGLQRIRLITYRGVTDADIAVVLGAFAAALRDLPGNDQD